MTPAYRLTGSSADRARASRSPCPHSTPVAEFQGTGFTLADMATAIEASRALTQSAARRRDAGQDVTKLAAMAKLLCTDTAMTVTTSIVQILGAVGYTTRYLAERYMREPRSPDSSCRHRRPQRC